jgi:hypothetical protein
MRLLLACMFGGHPVAARSLVKVTVTVALALDVSGAASGLGLQAQWLHIGSVVGFALVAGASTRPKLAPSGAALRC